MMPRPILRTTAIDVRYQADDELQRPLPEHTSRHMHESNRPAASYGSCFEHCGPIRAGCPGPGAQMSVHEGRWVPICRRATG